MVFAHQQSMVSKSLNVGWTFVNALFLPTMWIQMQATTEVNFLSGIDAYPFCSGEATKQSAGSLQRGV